MQLLPKCPVQFDSTAFEEDHQGVLVCVCVCIYIERERETEIQRERKIIQM